MDSVPLNFIDDTLACLHPRNLPEIQKIDGFWGHQSQCLLNETDHLQLILNLSSLPLLHIYFHRNRSVQSVQLEDVLDQKHLNIFQLLIVNAPGVHPGAIEVKNPRIVSHILSRSNGLTFVLLSHWPKEASVISEVLQAIPRIRQMIVNPRIECGSETIENLIEKHIDLRCFDGLGFGNESVPDKFFPSVRMFLNAAEISEFEFAAEGKDAPFMEEIVAKLVENWRLEENRTKKIQVTASKSVLKILRPNLMEDEGKMWIIDGERRMQIESVELVTQNQIVIGVKANKV